MTGVITRIAVTGIRYPAGSLHRTRWGEHEEACVVIIDDDAGARGVAIARCHLGRSAAALAEEIAVLAGELRGISLTGLPDVEAAFEKMIHTHLAQYVSVFAVSALDVALWDLLGVSQGVPVRALLGGDTAVEHVPAYASLPHLTSAAQAVEVAGQTLAAGFETVKLHSTGEVSLDVEIVTALRRELGADARLAFDAARTLDRDRALTLATTLHDLGYLWFEEPFEPYADADYAWLASQVAIPLAGFETAPGGPDGARWAIERGLVQRLLVDCYWKAGLTGASRVAATAAAAGQQLLVHHGASVAMNLANLQLAAARPALGAVELLAPFGEYDVGASLVALVPGAGVELPTGPGLGLVLDDEFIAAHRVGTSPLVELT